MKPDTGQANFSENRIRSGPLLSWILAIFFLSSAAAGGRRRIGIFDHRKTFGDLQRGLETLREPLADITPHHDTIDHDVDVMREFLVERGRFGQFMKLAVDLDALESLLEIFGELLLVFALAATHDRREQIEPRAFGQRQHAIDHLRDDLAFDRQARGRRVGHADARPQQAHVVVDLGDGADRRARIFRRGLLLDRDRRRQPVDLVDVGLLHHLQELARIGRQRLDVAPLAFGVDRVEGERGFAGAGQAREHDELVARYLDVDVFQIVLARAANGDRTQAPGGLTSCFQNFIHVGISGRARTRGEAHRRKAIGASDQARNIGRTGMNFQCRVKTINR